MSLTVTDLERVERSPRRIQRKRTKGWRMPEGAVYVGRPTKWGNPLAIGSRPKVMSGGGPRVPRDSIRYDRWSQLVLEHYERWVLEKIEAGDLVIDELRGKDLACWCPLDQPCHADVLLDIANQ